MSKPGTSAPPSVNVGQLIGQQGQSNASAAELQSGLNNAGVSSPFGSSFWTPTAIDPGTGHPSNWQQTQQLSGPAQQVFGNQLGLAGWLANNGAQLSQDATSLGGAGGGLVYNALAAMPQSASATNQAVTSAQNAAYNTQAGYLNPQFAEKQSDLNQQLADQGISAGSDAYSRAQGDLGRESDLAYQQAQNAAVAAGNQEQNTLFGQNLATGQFGQNLLSSSAADLSGLGSLANFGWAGGIPSQGGSPSGVAASNLGQLQAAANQGNQNNFAGGQSILSGLGGIGNALGGSNLLFGTQGLTGLLGGNSQTGLLGSLGSLLGIGGGGGPWGFTGSLIA